MSGYERYFMPSFWSFTAYTPTIPKLYWNVRSQEQRILNIFQLVDKVISYVDNENEAIADLAQKVQELESEINDPEFYTHIIDIINEWIDTHMPEILGNAARIVYFGLTDNGHFAAYIPYGNAWDDVQFDTGQTYINDDYGRLKLYYNVDESPVIWN